MRLKRILLWFVDNNPMFVLLIGLCSSLAISTTFEASFMLGICVFLVLILSSIITAIISKWVPDGVKIPSYIIIVTTIVTFLEILLRKYVNPLYETFGIYLPLISVNFIIIKPVSDPLKTKLNENIKGSIKIGIQYILSISLFGLIREILGNNTITIMDKTSGFTGYRAVYKIFEDNSLIPNNIFLTSAGAFLLLGLIIGIINSIKSRGENK